MALIKCEECGNEVSTQAKRCPKCGAKVPKKKTNRILVWGLVIGVVAMIYFQQGSNEERKQEAAINKAPAAPAPSHDSRNKAHSMMLGMSTIDRNVAFARLLKSSDVACGAVTKNFFQGFDEERVAYWNVACSNMQSWVISIHPDSVGSTQILGCDVLKAVKAGECFRKF